MKNCLVSFERMKSQVVSSFFFLIFFVAAFGSIFQSCNVTSSNKIVGPGYYCKVETFSSQNSSMSIFMNLTRPLHKIMVRTQVIHSQKSQSLFQMNFEFGYSMSFQQPFRTLLKVENVSIWEIFGGKRKNVAITWLFKVTGNTIKKVIHPCPYIVSPNNSIRVLLHVFKNCEFLFRAKLTLLGFLLPIRILLLLGFLSETLKLQ